jgi:hypothetical protein
LRAVNVYPSKTWESPSLSPGGRACGGSDGMDSSLRRSRHRVCHRRRRENPKGGVRYEVYDDCCGSGQERLPSCRLPPSGQSGRVASAVAQPVPALFGRAPAGPGAAGGLRHSPLLGQKGQGIWPSGSAAAAGPCPSLCAAQQDRPHGHQGVARGPSQRRDPSGARQIGRAADAGRSASAALGLDGHPHRPHQSRPWPAARAGPHHPARSSARRSSGLGGARRCRQRAAGTPCV